MPIDRTNTDFRDLEHRINEALTWQELDRALNPITTDMLKIGATTERQGVAIAQAVVRLGTVEERTATMAAYLDKVADSFRQFANELNDANKSIDALRSERDKFKWLARILWALAVGLAVVVFKAVEIWLAHR